MANSELPDFEATVNFERLHKCMSLVGGGGRGGGGGGGLTE